MAADKAASFSINLDSNAGEVGGEAAAKLEELRRSIATSDSAVKQLGASLRSLRGKSDEVVAAKGQLKAMLDAEKDKISAANLALLKQGTTYDKLAQQAKKAANETAKVAKVESPKPANDNAKAFEGLVTTLKAAGGPLERVAGGFEKVQGLSAGAAGGIGVAVAVLAAGIEIAKSFAEALFDIGKEFVKIVAEGANASRTMGLYREALLGSSREATHLGHQVDVLALKLPLPKERINEIANATTRALMQTRVSGQGIVDTFAAVAGASSAMGDEVGNQISEIIKRGKDVGRIQIAPPTAFGAGELAGTGLQFKDVADEIAKQMNIGVDQAAKALRDGRVPIDAGAKALRAAVEKRFGEINARKLLDFNVILAKGKEVLASYGKDIKLEPILEGFKKFVDLLDPTKSQAAKGLKTIVTVLANELGPAMQKAYPIVEKGFLIMVDASLQFLIALYKARNSIRDAFDKAGISNIDVATKAMTAFENVVQGAAIAAVTLVNALAKITTLSVQVGAAIGNFGKGAKTGIDSGEFKKQGQSAMLGLAQGILDKEKDVGDAMLKVADKAKETFTDALGIHSPSKVFEEHGRQTGEGYAQGVESSAGRAQRAAEAMAPAPPSGGRGAGRGGPVTVNVTLNATSMQNAQQPTAQQLTDPMFLAKLTKAIEDALLTQGIPVQTEAA